MKSSAKNSDSVDNSDDDGNNRHIDLSIMRKPISTSVSSFLEVMKAYDNGTQEIKKLLTLECDIIYECKVCRNIFRSLINFISHKRIYCTDCFNSSHHFHFRSNGFIDSDVATIIQTEAEYVNNPKIKKIPLNNNSSSTNSNNINKDLSSIIERLLKNQNNNRLNKMTEFYDKINHKITQNDMLKKEHVVELNNVNDVDDTKNVAVYQTIKETGNEENMKTQVNEIQDMLLNNKTVLGPDGKVISMDKMLSNDFPGIVSILDESGFKDTAAANFKCDTCELNFVTEKTLQLHNEMKHTSSTYVYPCPSCSVTFKKPGAVIRHLTNDHKKSMRRIRTLRDSIFKKRIRVDEIVAKGPSRELSRLQVTDQDKQYAAAAENDKAWMENLEHFDNQPMCPNCGKKFERKAVLTTHMNSCVLKASKLFSKQLQQAKISTKDSLIPSGSATTATTTTNTTTATVTTNPNKTELLDSDSNDVSNGPTEAIILESNLHNKLKNGIDNMVDSENSSVKSESILKEKENITTSTNKRKRKRAVRITTKNDNENNYDDDVYWSLDEDNKSLSVKKFIKENDFETKKATAEPVIAPKPLNKELSTSVNNNNSSNNNNNNNSSNTNNNNHRKISSNDKEHTTCNLCTKTFSTYYNLKRHASSFHCNQNRHRFSCAMCTEFITYKKSMAIQHIGVVHNVMGDKNVINDMINVHVEDITNEIDFNLVNENFFSFPKGKTLSQVANDSKLDDNSMDLSNGCTEVKSNFADVDDQSNNSNNSNSESCDSIKKKAPRSRPLSRKLTQTPNLATMTPTTSSTSTANNFEGTICKTPKPTVNKSNDLITPGPFVQKRPIRNRIKPVNKDFVYDLSGLLKKESETLKDFTLPSSFLVRTPNKRKSYHTSTPVLNESIEKIVKHDALPEVTITVVNSKNNSVPKSNSSNSVIESVTPILIETEPVIIDLTPDVPEVAITTPASSKASTPVPELIPMTNNVPVITVNNTEKQEVTDNSKGTSAELSNGTMDKTVTAQSTNFTCTLPANSVIISVEHAENGNATEAQVVGESKEWIACLVPSESVSLPLKKDISRKYNRNRKANFNVIDKSNVNNKIRKYKKRVPKKILPIDTESVVTVESVITANAGPIMGKPLKPRNKPRKNTTIFVNDTDENAFLQKIREFNITANTQETDTRPEVVVNVGNIVEQPKDDILLYMAANQLTPTIPPPSTISATITSSSGSETTSTFSNTNDSELAAILSSSSITNISPSLSDTVLALNNSKRITLVERMNMIQNKKRASMNSSSD